jgi:Zn-dependent peptidase ImmA (M78 family)
VANRQELITAYLAFFGVSSPSEWQDRYASFLQQTAFRTSRKIQSKAGSLSIWLRQGEIEASRIMCRPWDAEVLKTRLADIKVLSKAKNPLYYLPRIQKLCAAAGVAVVYVRAPEGCAASGATRFLSSKKAMVVLSLRYLSDDHFWFTLFHEFGHLLLHSSSLIFIDGEERIHGDMEREANEFAEHQLIPIHLQEKLSDLPVKRESIIRFAIEAGVSPGVVVGQMQHKGLIKRNRMNFLKKKFHWDKLAAVIA